MTQNEIRIPNYQLPIAVTLLPGDDFHTVRLRADLSEMLVLMSERDVVINLYTVGDWLAEYVPRRIMESSPAWKEQKMESWVSIERPQIFKALSDYFIEGGMQDRMATQSCFLADLVSATVKIEGLDILTIKLSEMGNWHDKFMWFAIFGRPEGVRFQYQYNHDIDALISTAMEKAGFSREQIGQFFATTS